MPKAKKVILLIVEGDSEEILLYERLRTTFKEVNIHFEIQNGDILFRRDNRTTIKAAIGKVVQSVLRIRKFKRTDIVAIFHIIDTDGCFISNDKILINSSQEKNTIYDTNGIIVKNQNQKRYIEERNSIKSSNINVLYTSNAVNKGMFYRMYYFSRNLEHVVFNDCNPDDDKIENIENFVANLDIPIDDFLVTYMPIFESTNLNEQYKESWEMLRIGTNSLSRLTNIPLLFIQLQEQVSDYR